MTMTMGGGGSGSGSRNLSGAGAGAGAGNFKNGRLRQPCLKVATPGGSGSATLRIT